MRIINENIELLEQELDKIVKFEGDNFTKRRTLLYEAIQALCDKIEFLEERLMKQSGEVPKADRVFKIAKESQKKYSGTEVVRRKKLKIN